MKVNELMHKLAPVIKLNKRLNEFGYGIKDPHTGKLVEDLEDSEYRSLSVVEFEHLRGGICWDYTTYYDKKLTSLGFTPMNIFIAFASNKENFSTHTVTILEIADFYVWVESAWKSMCGIYIANDLDGLLNAIVEALILEKGLKQRWSYRVHDYYEAPPVGTNSNDYLKYVLSSKTILSGTLKPSGSQTPKFKKLNGGQLNVLTGTTFMEDGDDSEGTALFTEASIEHSFQLKDLMEKKIFDALSDPVKRRKYTHIQSDYIDRNAEKLATAGPQYLIVFGTKDHNEYYELFGINKDEIVATLKDVLKKSGVNPDAKFLTQNVILHVLYFCIRYFTLNKDEKGVNSTLGIYALGVYWSTFTKYFPKGVIEPVMAYTIDNMTDKFAIKKAGNIFNALMMSIQQSYSFHKRRFLMGGDDDVCAWCQRIKNDQNSMFRKIANQYMENYRAGNAVTTRNDEYDDDTPIIDDVENATTKISTLSAAIVPQMISNGVDLRLAMASAKFAQISVSDCREYLTELITDKYLADIESIVQSTLYIFLVSDQRSSREIKSQYFLNWGYNLFKKTNSKDPNILNINAILEKWASESGIYERYHGKGTRINYRKAIYLYIILTIQKYMP